MYTIVFIYSTEPYKAKKKGVERQKIALKYFNHKKKVWNIEEKVLNSKKGL